MNLITRCKAAARAFVGKRPFDSVEYGLKVTRCRDCEHMLNSGVRDNMLVTVGARAAYMDDANVIKLPSGLDGESELAIFAAKAVDCFLNVDLGISFDEYIERALVERFGE